MSKSVADKSWVAGFFDGEGSLGIYKNKNTLSPRLSVAQRGELGRTTLLPLQEVYGGLLYLAPGNMWTWVLQQSNQIKTFIQEIAPFSQIKRPQFDLMLEYLAAITSAQHGPKQISEEEKALRQGYADKMKVLKHG